MLDTLIHQLEKMKMEILNNMNNAFFDKLCLEQKLFWNWQRLKLQYGYPKLYYSLKIAYTWLKIQKMKIEQLF